MPIVSSILSLVVLVACDRSHSNTFSDVHIHEETGDVLGTELLVREAGDDRATGEVRFYEGSDCPARLSLSGTIRDGAVRLRENSANGAPLELLGQMSAEQFTGTLNRGLELKLPRVEASNDLAVACGEGIR